MPLSQKLIHLGAPPDQAYALAAVFSTESEAIHYIDRPEERKHAFKCPWKGKSSVSSLAPRPVKAV